MSKKIRLEYLDSVRGIAALMVVFYHFIGWRWGEEPAYNIASMVFNGSDAVSFFFVLSGFVLSYKYFHFPSNEINIPQYIYKRILRLYPAFIFTILLNYLYWHRNELGWHVLADVFYYNRMQLWEELLMVRGMHKFYVPGWTLGVEMALSLLMPILIAAALKNIKLIIWLLPITVFVGSYLSGFTFHFALGIILAYYFPKIRDYDSASKPWYKYRYLLGFLIFLLFSIRHIDRLVTFGPTYNYIAGLIGLDFFDYTAVASFFILLWVINQPKLQQMLHHQVFLFLGKISYSVYLMHWLFVVYVMEHWDKWDAYLTNPYVKFLTLLFAVLVGTIVSATAVYYGIEKVFIRVARKKYRWQFWLK